MTDLQKAYKLLQLVSANINAAIRVNSSGKLLVVVDRNHTLIIITYDYNAELDQPKQICLFTGKDLTDITTQADSPEELKDLIHNIFLTPEERKTHDDLQIH